MKKYYIDNIYIYMFCCCKQKCNWCGKKNQNVKIKMNCKWKGLRICIDCYNSKMNGGQQRPL